MKKLMVALFVAFFAVPGVVFADEPAGRASEESIRLQEGYIHPLLSREMHRVQIARQEAYMRSARGVFSNAWLSIPLEKEPSIKPSGAEGHIELGWAGTVCETDVRVSTGAHLMWSEVSELLEQQLEWGVARLYTAAEETWDLRMRVAWVSTSTFSDGAVVLQPHIVNEWREAFGFERLNLEQSFTFSNDSGFEGRGFENSSSAIHFGWDLKLAWKISSHAALAAGYTGVFPLRRGDDDRGQVEVFSIGFEYKF